MRRTLLALAAVASMFTGGAFLTSQAQALPFGSPAAIQGGVADVSPTDQVRNVCRMVRTRYGLRRSCVWVPNRRVISRPYYRGYRGGYHGGHRYRR